MEKFVPYRCNEEADMHKTTGADSSSSGTAGGDATSSQSVTTAAGGQRPRRRRFSYAAVSPGMRRLHIA